MAWEPPRYLYCRLPQHSATHSFKITTAFCSQKHKWKQVNTRIQSVVCFACKKYNAGKQKKAMTRRSDAGRSQFNKNSNEVMQPSLCASWCKCSCWAPMHYTAHKCSTAIYTVHNVLLLYFSFHTVNFHFTASQFPLHPTGRSQEFCPSRNGIEETRMWTAVSTRGAVTTQQ